MLRNYFKTIINLPVANYDFDPELCIDHHPGLLNLGNTCYMNSILQQLYSLPIFLKPFLENANSNQGYKELQNIFYSMAFTSFPVVTPEEFIKKFVWRDGTKINIHAQQDAFEFFQYFLQKSDNFDASSIFCGSTVSTISNKELNVSKKEFQNFYGLNIPVKNNNSLNEVLENYSMPEKLEGNNQYFDENLNRMIDAEKSTFISESPQILVFQLMRFYYDKKKKTEMKINDAFYFPSEVDISKCSIGVENTKYKIHGVVIHNGTATGGHYLSIIKYNGDWYKFNDNIVTKISQKEFDNLTIGNPKQRTSAYLLFYVRNDVELKDPLLVCPPKLLEQVEKDNTYYQKIILAFSEPFISVSLRILTRDDFFMYFFRILSHSKRYHLLSKKIMAKVMEEKYEVIMKRINDNLQVVMDVFALGSVESKTVFTTIISNSMYRCESPYSLNFFNAFFKNAQKILKSYRNVSSPFIVMNIFLSKSKENIKIAIEEKWILFLLNFSAIIYDKKQSDSYIKNVETQELFLCIQMLKDSLDEGGIKVLHIIEPRVQLNQKNYEQFEKLMKVVAKIEENMKNINQETSKQNEEKHSQENDEDKFNENQTKENEEKVHNEEIKSDEKQNQNEEKQDKSNEKVENQTKENDEKVHNEEIKSDEKQNHENDENKQTKINEKDQNEEKKSNVASSKNDEKFVSSLDFVSLLLTETDEEKMKQALKNETIDTKEYFTMLENHKELYPDIAKNSHILVLDYLLSNHLEFNQICSNFCQLLPQQLLYQSFIKKIEKESQFVLENYTDIFFDQFNQSISDVSPNKTIINFISNLNKTKITKKQKLHILKSLSVYKDEQTQSEIKKCLDINDFSKEDFVETMKEIFNISREIFFVYLFDEINSSNIWRFKLIDEIISGIDMTDKEKINGQMCLINAFNRYDDFDEDFQSTLISSAKKVLKYFILPSEIEVNCKALKHILLDLNESEQLLFIPFLSSFQKFVDYMKNIDEFASISLLLYHCFDKKSLSDEEVFTEFMNCYDKCDDVDDYIDDCSLFSIALMFSYTNAFINLTLNLLPKTDFDFPKEKMFYEFCLEKMNDEQIKSLINSCETTKKPSEKGFNHELKRIIFLFDHLPNHRNLIHEKIHFTKEECESLPKKLSKKISVLFN
ncbi:Clan CA, family C19, ubiquitin hydrolase-like cysteine peptidase [Trichomonas vaginalis G3]|uniref:Clan CA, family C19, ubiquitin hydrolase-like cysteine peptidase n=1 Tax=Trichomonas vaginalis (strain ATCC PRA-98 / G3) TaxID=412133 RepID=A2EEN3_TRIV3|nr:ubiquitinyl hydrolase protein [Trichomonas vaginalis G3]EAY08839.1 Clan CA, family C19, ubiquitin hydrolase-like cysteine peptidase [Trichomonas vaginalis G3]KAI5489334.1 ubiquitinyl hydrolase protein [Trichomonas vaginalis G3]|eukprot:XP_001321062.1 Clan CA, family C19, ubiquitin hydrolase-like cysteine peptidase [Trichomonas vaginalis G3]